MVVVEISTECGIVWGLNVIVVFFIAVFLIIAILMRVPGRRGGGPFPWVQFFVRGKEAGFSFTEIVLMKKLASANRIPQPTSLFWSVKSLDRCIRSAVTSVRAAGTADNSGNAAFINKLFDFRARVEFSQPKYRLGISSTRGIAPGQTMKVMVDDAGVVVVKLVENTRRFMVVAYPRGAKTPSGLSWKKRTLKVHLWRRDDAGYYFETRVLDELLDRSVPVLHLAHVDNLVRTQKRQSVRREAGVSARLFPLGTIDQANETVDHNGGYRCKLLDISEDGAALIVGGNVKAGVAVKIQAQLNGDVVILNGTVRSATFRRDNNTTVLHVQAKRPSDMMRVSILTYVYRLVDSQESRDAPPVDSTARGNGAHEETDAPGETEITPA